MNQYIGIYRRAELFFIRTKLEQYGLAPLEGKVLLRLQCDSCGQDELGGFFEVDKGRMARILLTLEERQLICRGVNEKNRRQKLVALTPDGRQMVENIKKVFEEWDTACFRGFSDEERQKYTDFIRRITENVMECRHTQGGNNNGE